eukprot:143432-Chlamydomonas_euryale.AAC.2
MRLVRDQAKPQDAGKRGTTVGTCVDVGGARPAMCVGRGREDNNDGKGDNNNKGRRKITMQGGEETTAADCR